MEGSIGVCNHVHVYQNENDVHGHTQKNIRNFWPSLASQSWWSCLGILSTLIFLIHGLAVAKLRMCRAAISVWQLRLCLKCLAANSGRWLGYYCHRLHFSASKGHNFFSEDNVNTTFLDAKIPML